VSLSRMSLVVSDCAQHTVASWMYRAIDEQHSAVGRSLPLRPTVWNSLQDELREETENTFRLSLRRRFSDNISVFSALEVFYDNALYKSTSYLLTYFCADLSVKSKL